MRLRSIGGSQWLPVVHVMAWMQVLGLGRIFNLSMQLDRIELTLSLVRAYFLMVVMARSVPGAWQAPHAVR